MELTIVRGPEFRVPLTGYHQASVFGSGGTSDRLADLGLELTWLPAGVSLLILQVTVGPVQEWNRWHPGSEVRCLDRIVAVDGIRATDGNLAELLKPLKAGTATELTICRPGAGLDQLEARGLAGLRSMSSHISAVASRAVARPRKGPQVDVSGLSDDEEEGSGTKAGGANDVERRGRLPLGPAAGAGAGKANVGYNSHNLSSGDDDAAGCNKAENAKAQRRGLTPVTSVTTSATTSASTSPREYGRVAMLTRADDQNSVSQCGTSVVESTVVDSVAFADEQPLVIGERIYYAAGRQNFDNGDQLAFGNAGKVVSLVSKTKFAGRRIGRGDGSLPDFVEVKMEGNSKPVCVRSNEVSRAMPVMPKDWAVGDMVFYRGPEKALSSTDVLTPGLEGEVVGRAARRGDGKDDIRVSVKFKGHKRNTPIITKAIKKIHADEWM